MKRIILIISLLIFAGPAFADAVYKTNGELVDKKAWINIYPVQYKLKADAEAKALEVRGQVYRDQDTKLYQVLYGNVEITGIVTLETISE